MRIAMFRRNIAYLLTKNEFLEIPNYILFAYCFLTFDRRKKLC
jgi:hypothetical protein